MRPLWRGSERCVVGGLNRLNAAYQESPLQPTLKRAHLRASPQRLCEQVGGAGYADRSMDPQPLSVHASSASATVALIKFGPVVVRAAATNSVTLEMLPGQPLPNVDAELKENAWNLGTIGAGTGVGDIVALVTGRPTRGLLGP